MVVVDATAGRHVVWVGVFLVLLVQILNLLFQTVPQPFLLVLVILFGGSAYPRLACVRTRLSLDLDWRLSLHGSAGPSPLLAR